MLALCHTWPPSCTTAHCVISAGRLGHLSTEALFVFRFRRTYNTAGEPRGDEYREDAGDGNFGGAPAELLLVLGPLLRFAPAGDVMNLINRKSLWPQTNPATHPVGGGGAVSLKLELV